MGGVTRGGGGVAGGSDSFIMFLHSSQKVDW